MTDKARRNAHGAFRDSAEGLSTDDLRSLLAAAAEVYIGRTGAPGLAVITSGPMVGVVHMTRAGAAELAMDARAAMAEVAP